MNGHRRRDSGEITYAILKAAAGGQRKTRIMYQSSLNLKQLNQYIEELVLNELLGYQPATRCYQTTERGRTFTRMFENYKETRDLLSEQEKALGRFLTTRAKKSFAVPL
ncbi:MAG: winged helix-turn-helix domain-containing protein [Nitrososphaerales archaeon]